MYSILFLLIAWLVDMPLWLSIFITTVVALYLSFKLGQIIGAMFDDEPQPYKEKK
jgi:hypothetical protein